MFSPSIRMIALAFGLVTLLQGAAAAPASAVDSTAERHRHDACKEQSGSCYVQKTKRCTPCKELFPGSKTCTESGATSCERGYTLYHKQCNKTPVCTPGTYLDTERRHCPRCPDPKAATCASGTGLSTSCKEGTLVKGKCVVVDCSKQYGTCYVKKTNQCTPCKVLFPGSKTCTESGATACEGGYTLYHKQCIKTPVCTPGTYLDTERRHCPRCPDPKAATCASGTGLSTSCKEGTLVKGKCVVVDCSKQYGTCYVKKTNQCTPCKVLFPGSKTCTESGATSCEREYTLRNGKCYRDEDDCKKHFPGCKTCTKDEATSCEKEYTLRDKHCVRNTQHHSN